MEGRRNDRNERRRSLRGEYNAQGLNKKSLQLFLENKLKVITYKDSKKPQQKPAEEGDWDDIEKGELEKKAQLDKSNNIDMFHEENSEQLENNCNICLMPFEDGQKLKVLACKQINKGGT